MWNKIKKWFKLDHTELSKKDLNSQSISVTEQFENRVDPESPMNLPNDEYYQDNYEYGFGSKQLTEFERLMYSLRAYSGYIRESTLKQIQDNYDSELFPHMMYRLSDYVEANRLLAKQHIERWSEKSAFPKLCIDNFLEIAALKYRERTDQDALHLLLSEVAENKAYLSETLTSQQGKLPRVLLNFIVEYQWINEKELVGLCRNAKDQKIRAYWLENILKNESDELLICELKRNQFKDVQYRLFDVLFRKGQISIDSLILFWESKYPSLMDYAYFALRQKNFDFENYFTEKSIKHLTNLEAKVRVQQWILYKGDSAVFFEVLKRLDSIDMANSFVLKVLKLQYISFENYLDYLTESKQVFNFHHLSKLKKYRKTHLNLDEMIRYLRLVDEPITLKQRLQMVDGYNGWEQLYWFVMSQQYIQNEADKIVFDAHIRAPIYHLSYEIYGVRWNVEQKEQMQTLLPTFVQKYSELFDNSNVKNILQPYLES